MKKSNLILVAIFSVTVVWTLILGFLGASALNDIDKGKTPSYVFSSQQKKPIEIPPSRIPVKELYIFATNSVIVHLSTGKELSLSNTGSMKKNVSVSNKNGKVEISIQKTDEQMFDLYITVPDLSNIIIDHAYDVRVTRFSQRNLNLQCNPVIFFSMDSCQIKALDLGVQMTKEEGNIQIGDSNRIDSLSIRVQGKGSLKLGIAGQFYNKLWLSDKIEIIAAVGIYKQLNIESLTKKEE